VFEFVLILKYSFTFFKENNFFIYKLLNFYEPLSNLFYWFAQKRCPLKANWQCSFYYFWTRKKMCVDHITFVPFRYASYLRCAHVHNVMKHKLPSLLCAKSTAHTDYIIRDALGVHLNFDRSNKMLLRRGAFGNGRTMTRHLHPVVTCASARR
jgi:hypothetical protein